MEKNNYWDPQYTYKKNQYYKLFEEEKQKIKDKYPPHIFENTISGLPSQKLYKKYIESNDRELYQQYLKELADLMFKPNGIFQEFVWDTMSQVEKEEMEKLARGRISGNGEYS